MDRVWQKLRDWAVKFDRKLDEIEEAGIPSSSAFQRASRVLDWFMVVVCLWLTWQDLDAIIAWLRHPTAWGLVWPAWDAFWIWRLVRRWGYGGWGGGGGWEDEPDPDPVPQEPASL